MHSEASVGTKYRLKSFTQHTTWISSVSLTDSTYSTGGARIVGLVPKACATDTSRVLCEALQAMFCSDRGLAMHARDSHCNDEGAKDPETWPRWIESQDLRVAYLSRGQSQSQERLWEVM